MRGSIPQNLANCAKAAGEKNGLPPNCAKATAGEKSGLPPNCAKAAAGEKNELLDARTTRYHVRTHAGMAQWQSNGFVNRGLGVRLPLPAPEKLAGSRDGRGPAFLSTPTFTCKCVRIVSIDTPGREVYVDKFLPAT